MIEGGSWLYSWRCAGCGDVVSASDDTPAARMYAEQCATRRVCHEGRDHEFVKMCPNDNNHSRPSKCGPAEEPHECPFAQEMSGATDECECRDRCYSQCAGDV